MAILCRGLKYLFYPMGIAQWQVALAAVSGLVAKESVAGMLALFYGDNLAAAMSAPSAVAFLLFILACSPCVSAIAASAREVGVKRALANAGIQTAFAFLLAYAAYGLLAHGAAAAVIRPSRARRGGRHPPLRGNFARRARRYPHQTDEKA